MYSLGGKEMVQGCKLKGSLWDSHKMTIRGKGESRSKESIGE
jgi:hypothetical protein